MGEKHEKNGGNRSRVNTGGKGVKTPRKYRWESEWVSEGQSRKGRAQSGKKKGSRSKMG